jgi:hypothetical protein
MAARTNLRQQEQTREAIRTTQLVKRLQFYALGESDEAGNAVDLDAGKLKAIEVLLRKSLPDLSSVTLSGDPDRPVAVTFSWLPPQS